MSASSSSSSFLSSSSSSPPPSINQTLDAFNTWKSRRRAIIHSIDSDGSRSRHAQKIVRHFRHGLYYSHVDFHVADVREWIARQQQERAHIKKPLASASLVSSESSESSSSSVLSPYFANIDDDDDDCVDGDCDDGEPAFLTHAVLDLPDVKDALRAVSSALYPDGLLVVYAPHITQLVECVQHIENAALPLAQDAVLELGRSSGVGGREWTVQVQKVPAVAAAAATATVKAATSLSLLASSLSSPSAFSSSSSSPLSSSSSVGESAADDDDEDDEAKPVLSRDNAAITKAKAAAAAAAAAEEEASAGPAALSSVVLCRPKFGALTVGGGFIGVWRKRRKFVAPSSQE